ncbi:MAG: hypothetical protein WC279_09730 [Sulfurimonas sp.]|jgi:hypothetical protein|uniref:hypothetical protein n=1 Tax=Sulfurimonas sp. TaxID=2022749 RepID=UPI0035646F5B
MDTRFRKYTKIEILSDAIYKRARGEKNVYTLFFEINNYKFGVVYMPYYLGGKSKSYSYAHFDFFCMSDNLQNFTSTGYYSIFSTTGGETAVFNKKLIEEYLFSLLEKSGFDVSKPSKPLQLSLF